MKELYDSSSSLLSSFLERLRIRSRKLALISVGRNEVASLFSTERVGMELRGRSCVGAGLCSFPTPEGTALRQSRSTKSTRRSGLGGPFEALKRLRR